MANSAPDSLIWGFIYCCSLASQINLCYLYSFGAALFCLSILAWLGPNDDAMCLLRPWAFHISLTIMFGYVMMVHYWNNSNYDPVTGWLTN